ncbi:MAG: hypothetical protein ACOX38_00505 [Bacillota bacterium]
MNRVEPKMLGSAECFQGARMPENHVTSPHHDVAAKWSVQGGAFTGEAAPAPV